MKLRAGQQIASTVDATRMIVVRAPGDDLAVTCAGTEMVDAKQVSSAASGTADPGQLSGTLLGKRYADDELGLELLCTKPGEGTVAVNGTALELKQSKPLPASD
jgi:hypothetical protein